VLLTVYKEITAKRNESIEQAVERAIERGEVPPDTSPPHVVRMLLGSMLLWGFAPDTGELLRPTEEEIDELIDVILNGVANSKARQPLDHCADSKSSGRGTGNS
jgi:hypothetical protein